MPRNQLSQAPEQHTNSCRFDLAAFQRRPNHLDPIALIHTLERLLVWRSGRYWPRRYNNTDFLEVLAHRMQVVVPTLIASVEPIA